MQCVALDSEFAIATATNPSCDSLIMPVGIRTVRHQNTWVVFVSKLPDLKADRSAWVVLFVSEKPQSEVLRYRSITWQADGKDRRGRRFGSAHK
jgi:hypothetical protein